jgi:hypothetical protein
MLIVHQQCPTHYIFVGRKATIFCASYTTTPNIKEGFSFDKKVIATIKYHWIDIQSKDFDGGLSIPTVKGLKNYETLPWLKLSHRAT